MIKLIMVCIDYIDSHAHTFLRSAREETRRTNRSDNGPIASSDNRQRVQLYCDKSRKDAGGRVLTKIIIILLVPETVGTNVFSFLSLLVLPIFLLLRACLYVSFSTSNGGGSLCDFLYSIQITEQRGERERRQGKREKREAQDRIKSS